MDYTNGHALQQSNGNGTVNEFHIHEGELVEPASVADHIRAILDLVNEDSSREGLLETPDRVERMYAEILQGYDQDPADVMKLFENSESYSDYVLVKDIEFYSMCEHHMLPFFGKAHIAYIPTDKIVGLSKLPRLVEIYARRLQLQEKLTGQIRSAIDEYLQPKGTLVITDATHMCVAMRGVRNQNSITTTESTSGVFKEDAALRERVLQQIHRSF